MSGSAAVGRYPVRTVRLELAGTALRLLVVRRLEDYVDREALLGTADIEEPPYWMHIWPGSRCLAAAVAARRRWEGLRVVDVGCGIGLAGLIAARAGAEVVLTDFCYDAVAFARANAELNGCRVAVLQDDVRCTALTGSFDCCLVADVTYDTSLQNAVARFLAEHLAPAGWAWCAESVRTVDMGFRHACESLGLGVAEREVVGIDEDRPVPIRITEVRRSCDG